MRLRVDESVALEDPPHGRDRGHIVDLALEVISDGLWSGVMSGRGQLVAEFDDQLLDFGLDLVGARLRFPRAWL